MVITYCQLACWLACIVVFTPVVFGIIAAGLVHVTPPPSRILSPGHLAEFMAEPAGRLLLRKTSRQPLTSTVDEWLELDDVNRLWLEGQQLITGKLAVQHMPDFMIRDIMVPDFTEPPTPTPTPYCRPDGTCWRDAKHRMKRAAPA